MLMPSPLLRSSRRAFRSSKPPILRRVPTKLPVYHELDLLRRDGFAAANSATVSLRVLDREGFIPPGLQPADFALVVNGKPRDFRLHAPGTQASVVPPMVLLVFPPNDPVVHN